jgi:hypothetical protein
VFKLKSFIWHAILNNQLNPRESDSPVPVVVTAPNGRSGGDLVRREILQGELGRSKSVFTIRQQKLNKKITITSQSWHLITVV